MSSKCRRQTGATMGGSNRDQSVYAAGQAREFLQGELEGKENTWIERYAGLIDDDEVLDWLNYMCSIYQDNGMDFLETKQARIVLRSAATKTANEAFREGQASQLQGLVGLVHHERDDAGDAIDEIVDRLSQEGCIALVVGPPGAGKTATTLDVARGWGVKTGGSIFGNTSWDGFDEIVETDVEMLEAMASVDGPTLGVVDESNQNLSGEGADQKKATQFVDRATFLRKREGDHGPYAKRGSMVIVGHTLRKTAADIRRLATLVVQKPSRADPGRLTLYDSPGGSDEIDEIDRFVGLTDTRESYDQHEASHFDVVLEDDDGDDSDDVDPDEIDDRRQIKTAIIASEKHGMTYNEIATSDLVDYGDTWVGDRVREWRRGDHRDLVPEDEIEDVDGED